MRKTLLWIVLTAMAGLLLIVLLRPALSPALAAPDGFASPIHAGCYLAAENQCKIHVDPFTININDGAGARLEQFTLFANNNPIYDFRPDASNPPAVDYTPSLVALDFAARCGITYTVSLGAKDTTDANALTYGLTTEFVCPAGALP